MDHKKGTSAHDIAEAIIADIRSGRSAAGDRLREQQLAERFGVSRGPVREALKLLASQFWVSHEPSRGARVMEIHPITHPDAAAIARALNAPLIQFAAARGTPADFDLLDSLVREMADAVHGEASPEAVAEFEWKIGRRLLAMARSPLLEASLQRFQSGAITQFNVESKRTRSMRVHVVNLWIDVVISLRQRDTAKALLLFDTIVDFDYRADARAKFHKPLYD